MADFPSTIRDPDWTQFSQKAYRRQLKTTMENGKVQSRPAHTTYKRIFTIGWKWLTTADYNTLLAHWYTNLGDTFNWTHPDTTVYEVRYADDTFPEVKQLDGNYWLGPEELILEEA